MLFVSDSCSSSSSSSSCSLQGASQWIICLHLILLSLPPQLLHQPCPRPLPQHPLIFSEVFIFSSCSISNLYPKHLPSLFPNTRPNISTLSNSFPDFDHSPNEFLPHTLRYRTYTGSSHDNNSALYCCSCCLLLSLY